MFESLRIFQVRESFEVEYSVPSIDTTNGSGVVILPPPAPVIIDITDYGLLWETVKGATQYTVEALANGTIWATIATVPAPTTARIIWTGTEWDIEQQISGIWQVVYRGFEPGIPGQIVGGSPVKEIIETPDLVPVWYEPDGVTVVHGLNVVVGNLISPIGMTITGAGVDSVNTTYDEVGLVNGRNSYLGPDVFMYDFMPELHVLYRVRAYNQAGPGEPSNVVELFENPTPPRPEFIVLRDDELPSPGAALPDVDSTNLKKIGGLLYESNNSDLFSSPDGFTWTNLTNTGDSIYGVDFGNGIYVASTDSIASTAYIYTSTDGISWTKVSTGVTLSSGGPEGDVLFDGTKFILGGQDGSFLTSTDGVSWIVSQPAILAYDSTPSRIRLLNGLYCAVVLSSGLLVSPDGNAWAPAVLPISLDDHIEDVDFGNGFFVTCGSTGKIVTSPDGVTWTLQTPTGLSGQLFCLTFGNGKFMVSGFSNKIWSSTDALTWTDSGQTPTTGMHSAIFFDSSFVIAL